MLNMLHHHYNENNHKCSERDDLWRGCYDHGWGKSDLVPDAFSHPAKLAKGLGFRIVEHAMAHGWLKTGDVCVDPFGGVATGALALMWNGVHYVGVELEGRFVSLAEQNIALWQRKYGSKPGFGSARIVQGDSRKLADVIAGADLICSSPPYAGSLNSESHGIDFSKCDPKWGDRGTDGRAEALERHQSKRKYGDQSGQLGAMKEGDAPRVDCVVSSPPYVSGGHHPDQTGAWNASETYDGRNRGLTKDQAGYGSTQGQMGKMPEGKFDAVVSSPPYEGSEVSPGNAGNRMNNEKWGSGKALTVSREYGESTGQLGNETGDTFWQAAREIVAQCYAILKPGGHAIWVGKDFVRKGKRVPFSDQWQALCEAQGFNLVCRHRAMLVAHHGEQDDMLGETKQLRTERKSFFRRLAEKKGSPAIDWEDVICLERSA